MADERPPHQKSQPKGRDEKGDPAKPMDIPVPKRSEFDRLLDKAEKPPKSSKDAV